MKSKILLVITLGIILGAGAFLYPRFQSKTQTVEEHVHKDVYYCPMHPQIQSDKPGNCPICYMKLVKKETEGQQEIQANQSSDHVAVKLTEAKQQLIGIKTMPV